MTALNDSELELYGIVGKMFREIRESKGLSLEISAAYLDIAPKSLQRYECGERKIKIGTIKKLCEFYKVNFDDFIKEAKIKFGGNIYTDISNKKEESSKIMQYYEQLNDIGKHEAEKRVEELTHLPKYTKEGESRNNTQEFSEELIPKKDYLLPNAAHADESLTEVTDEMIQKEDDIMDDEHF